MTADFDPVALKNWLLANDVRLRPPANQRATAALFAAFDGVVHPDVMAMYLTFDGCEQDDFEVDSFLTIWPIDVGLDYVRERDIRDHFAFADVDWAADVALCAITTPDAPVAWHDGILPPNLSFGAFWNVVMRGALWRQ